ncbi:hypothetical protein [Stutzerimonas nitrititolerans]|uniref:hypothetical protein n=1 Tax=Stutzerimonas nitrititolerans TaxID=2482751 RepID=UPI0028A80CED|nr:hypothetical protein [Stutzerimonas nitrititolerans]
MNTTVKLVDPQEAWIDRESNAHIATVRDADGDSVLTFSAAMPDDEIMRMLDSFNRVYARGYERGQEAKARELRAVLGVAASDS